VQEGVTPKEMSSTETPPVAWLADNAKAAEENRSGGRKQQYNEENG
jgi:hypothetical protein